jgi:serine/threonine protein kinase
LTSQGTDARSDLYSLAATLYHCLTGKPPEVSIIRLIEISQGRPDPLEPASALNPQVSDVIASVLMQAMALNRDSRFSSAKAMRRALGEVSAPPVIPPALLPVDIFDTIEMVEIPAGKFLMGSPDSEADRYAE